MPVYWSAKCRLLGGLTFAFSSHRAHPYGIVALCPTSSSEARLEAGLSHLRLT